MYATLRKTMMGSSGWALAPLALSACVIALSACVTQEPGLTVVVQIDPQPTATLMTPAGDLRVERARLDLGTVELLPCDDQAARARPRSPLSWLIGSARAHGDGADDALSAPVEPIEATDGAPRALARIALPPGLTVCGLRVAHDDAGLVALAGHIDGARLDWIAPIATAPQLPVRRFSLDSAHRLATITLAFDLATWTADLPDADEDAQARHIAANAAVALFASVAMDETME